MNFRTLLEFTWYKLFNPDVFDFVSMGMGIEDRYEKMEPWWRNHLHECKAVQREALNFCRPESIAILGSGRLYDVDSSLFNSHFEVHLYDYDPRSIAYCKHIIKNKSPVRYHCCDLTGVMEQWRDTLKAVVQCAPFRFQKVLKKEKIAHVLGGLTVPVNQLGERLRLRDSPPADLIVSLNILGQLGIYWSDRVESILGSSTVYTDLGDVVSSSIEQLESRHIEMLAASGAKVIVIITDERYHFYGEDTCSVAALSMPLDALIAKSVLFSEKYQQCSIRKWPWHINPWGADEKQSEESPAVHEVTAVTYKQKFS